MASLTAFIIVLGLFLQGKGHELFEQTVTFKSNTLTVSWQIYYQHVQCDLVWRVRVATEDFTLHPNQFPEDVPIALINEYNVSVHSNSAVCTDNVTLSLFLTENVLEHVPYIVCIIRTGSGATSESYRSDRVYTYLPTTTDHTDHTDYTDNTDEPTTQNTVSVTTPSQGNPASTLKTVISTDLVVSDGSFNQCTPHHILLFCICLYFITNLIICA